MASQGELNQEHYERDLLMIDSVATAILQRQHNKGEVIDHVTYPAINGGSAAHAQHVAMQIIDTLMEVDAHEPEEVGEILMTIITGHLALFATTIQTIAKDGYELLEVPCEGH